MHGRLKWAYLSLEDWAKLSDRQEWLAIYDNGLASKKLIVNINMKIKTNRRKKTSKTLMHLSELAKNRKKEI